MTFSEAITSVFSQYATFSGRARRSEYWYWVVLMMLVNAVFSFIGTKIPAISYVQAIWGLAILIPGLAVCIRRLHDIGKSGWNVLFCLIPCIGQILLIVWYATDSEPGTNQYGPCPK